MTRKIVTLDGIPSSPLLSHAVTAQGLVFISGQVGRDLVTRQAADGVAAQTRQCLENAKLVVEAAGSSFEHVVKTTVFLRDRRDFKAMNEVYQEYFPKAPPARSTVESALMSEELLVEVEMVAALPS